MTNDLMPDPNLKLNLGATGQKPRYPRVIRLSLLLLGLMGIIGCQTGKDNIEKDFKAVSAGQSTNRTEAVVLHEGDVLTISFPSAPNLNSPKQQIRRDGKIDLPVIGEVTAAGLTPTELEKALTERYKSELTSPQVNVVIESSSFQVFVTGAVLKPGKISSNRPLTAFEAIMEAGGPDYTKANLKKVKVIRQEGSKIKHYELNLKRIIDGQDSEPFYLKQSDTIFVPERFVLF